MVGLIPVEERAENEEKIIELTRPEFNYICYNSVRAGILHLLIKNKELGHALSVEEISKKLGKRHSVIIHHLEKLEEWRLVRVVKFGRHGNKERRRIWGLNLRYPNLIKEVYKHTLKFFYTQQELEGICSVNLSLRKAKLK